MVAASEEELEAVATLLEANGYATEDMPTLAMQITHLEIFLHEYPKMLGLSAFPNLKSLALIHQGIKEIRGLDQCMQLEKLWVVENAISSIQGLGALTRLKELYLYSNHISSMDGLSHLTNLEVLSLADNYIPAISQVSTMPRLRELNLARNDIAAIGDTLQENTALEVLNLSDNAIGSFKDIRPLTRLPYLTELCFADPMWGDCPLSSLCNYQTYVLFMLPGLVSLDTLLLAEETKQLAEATFLKKQMYYHMRMKTAHRNARNIIKLAAQGKKALLHHARPLVLKVAALQRELQRALEEGSHRNHTSPDTPHTEPSADGVQDTEGLSAKLTAAEAAMNAHHQWVGELEAEFEACSAQTYQVVDTHVARMMLELETAGNIRIEEGQPSDAWYTSCVDLVSVRFNAADYEPSLGITGIIVTSVRRIHNRWLRTRFDRVASSSMTPDAGGEGSSKQSLEYLLVGDHPALPGELDVVVEAGMRPGNALANLGLDGAVLLANSVALADQLRLQAALERRNTSAASMDTAGGIQDTTQPAVGRLIIAKAYLGTTASAEGLILSGSRLSKSGPVIYGKDGQLLPAALLDGPRVLRRNYPPGTDAVYRCRAGDAKQRQWYVFDHMAVLPEYVVEFRYELEPGSRLQPGPGCMSPGKVKSASCQAPHAAETVQKILSGLEPDLRPLARPLLGWLAYHFDPGLMDSCNTKDLDRAQVEELLQQLPLLPERPKLGTISPERLQLYTRCDDLTSLTYLNLHNCGLRKLEHLSSMKRLKVLVLSFNEVTRLEGLGELGGLQYLDAAHNLIRKVDGVKGLTSLQHLNLSFNQVVKLEEIYGLKKYVSQITFLDMSGNALCEDKSYRPTVLRKLTHLALFDGRRVSPAEAAEYGDNGGGLSLSLVLAAGSTGHLGGSGHSACPNATLTPAQIQELVLERRHIRRLQNLGGLVNLRRASFADNEISHIEGLDGCVQLEELCLEDNRIGSIEGLAGLTRLRKLQLGRNRLAGLDALRVVTGLTQLSVEDNDLKSLAGLEHLHCLMELYAGNNRLHELREVQRLRVLPKLIILDLSGNPCTAASADDYRLYVVFNVRKLKVLDGTPIDATEQAAAKSKYAGRLTLDFLEERLGHRMFDRIRDLDMAGMRIRDVGTVFMREELESLQELNLDNNLLVEVSGLALLRQLVVLQLNGNRLSEECNFNVRRMMEKNPDLYKAWLDPSRQRHHLDSSAPSLDLFPCLQALQLGSNQISSIGALQLGCLTSLRTLFLNNNDITRVEGLEGLVNLQELVLDRNRIRYIDPESLAGLGRLRELRLEDNGLRSLANLTALTGLQCLHVSNNRISELQELDRITGLTALAELALLNNPVTRKQGYRMQLITRIPRLCTADGQVITLEERSHADMLLSIQLQQQQQTCVGPDAVSGLALTPSGKGPQISRMDFASLAAAAAQMGQVPACAMPSIPSGVLLLAGPGALGLEGVGIRDLLPQGMGAREPGGLMSGVMAQGLLIQSGNGSDQSGRDGGGLGQGLVAGDKRGQGQRVVNMGQLRFAQDAAIGNQGMSVSARGGVVGPLNGSPARRQAPVGRLAGGFRGYG